MVVLLKTITDGLPEGSIVRVYRVDEWICQIGFVGTVKSDAEGTRSRGICFSVCTCPGGFLNLPRSLAGLNPTCCGHVREVLHVVSQTMPDRNLVSN